MMQIIRWVALLFLAFTAVSVSSQKKEFVPEMYIGANGGTTLSMVNFKPAVQQSYLMGYHGGMVFRYNSQNHLGVQAELNYMQRGWNELSGYSRRLDYVELPFMSHFYFGRALQFYFNIGPKVALLIGNQVLTPSAEISTAEQYSAIDRPIDYGFCGGFGFQLKTGKQIFLIDTRINFSTGNIFPDRMTDHFATSNNMNASLSAAWLIKTN
jgi:hypothetical protein